jgi:hypothetical protein
MKIGDLFCVHCGEKQSSDFKDDRTLSDCSKCSKKPVDAVVLLGALDILSGNFKLCPGCNTPALGESQFCFRCGESV